MMPPSASFAVALVLWACATIGCGPPTRRAATDRFVEGSGEIASWAESADGRVRVPLVAGLAWERAPDAEKLLLKMRAPEGPTFVVAAAIAGAPTPLAIDSCAETHRVRVTGASTVVGVRMTEPQITVETRKGVARPRLHYAVPLEPSSGARAASTLSAWTYRIDRDRCIGIGVTTVVRAKPDDATQPDPEDLQRLERVFGPIAEDTTVGR